jgi:hypothetical protein
MSRATSCRTSIKILALPPNIEDKGSMLKGRQQNGKIWGSVINMSRKIRKGYQH